MAGETVREMKSGCVYTFCDEELLSASFSQFETLKNDFKLCDVTVKAGERYFPAHSLILAIRIPYFNILFTCSGDKTKIKEIIFDEINPDALESLINFAYTGRVKITPENVRNLLLASSYFQLEIVKKPCVDFLKKGISLCTVLDIRNFSENQEYYTLVEDSDCYICEHFLEFSKTKDFLNLPYSCLHKVISDDFLNVSKEEEAYEAILSWTRANVKRHARLPELLKCVRMQMLPIDYLVDQVCTEPLIRSSPRCRKIVDDLKNYHLLPKKLPDLKTQPRQYRMQLQQHAVNESSVQRSQTPKEDNSLEENDASQDPQTWEEDETPCEQENHDMTGNHASGEDHALPQDQEKGIGEFICAVCCTQSLRVFGFQNQEWNRLTETRCTDVDCVTAVKDKIYIFSGSSVQTLEIQVLKWEKLGTEHDSILGAGIVPYGKKIYCFGGCSGSSRIVQSFDVEQNLWLMEGNMKKSRLFPAAVVSDGMIYVTGGYEGPTVFDLAERYHPETGQFSGLSPMLNKRWWHQTAAVEGKIYACGGCDHLADYLNTMESYDPTTNQWTFLSNMRKGRAFVSVVPKDKEIYVIGGLTEDDRFTDSVEIYDTVKNQWRTGMPVCGREESEVITRAVSITPE